MSATTTTLAPMGSANVVRNTLTIARRNLLHIKATPEQLVEMSIQPLMFLVLFVYVFGGAIAGSSREYLQFALPGILVQSVCIRYDRDRVERRLASVIDRFRSLRSRARRSSAGGSWRTGDGSPGASSSSRPSRCCWGSGSRAARRGLSGHSCSCSRSGS
jgi:hypothetical protein